MQFVKFPLRGQVPHAIGTDRPGLAAETVVSAEQNAALAAALADG